MAVEGPLALRVNTWDKENNIFHSPSWTDFTWPNSVIAQAKCDALIPCSLGEDGLLLIEKECTCGIYASLNKHVIDSYAFRPHSVWFLIEGWGEVWLHTDGFTAPAAQIIAIVNTDSSRSNSKKLKKEDGKFIFSGQNQALAAAQQTFNVPVLDLDLVRSMTRLQWVTYGMKWKEDFF